MSRELCASPLAVVVNRDYGNIWAESQFSERYRRQKKKVENITDKFRYSSVMCKIMFSMKSCNFRRRSTTTGKIQTNSTHIETRNMPFFRKWQKPQSAFIMEICPLKRQNVTRESQTAVSLGNIFSSLWKMLIEEQTYMMNDYRFATPVESMRLSLVCGDNRWIGCRFPGNE